MNPERRRSRTGILWAGAAFLLGLPLAQAAMPPPLEDYYRQAWTTRDGLPHNAINAMAQTPEGYLWFATWEGVARFNGREFVNFERGPATGLPDSAIRTLHLDTSGVLWAGGLRGGLARIDQGRWSALDAAPGLVVSLLVDGDGRLWAGTQGTGLARIEADGSRRIFRATDGLPSDIVSALLEDGQGVWIGTPAGLVRANGDAFRVPDASAGLSGESVLALARAADGRLLVGTTRGLFIAVGDGAPGFQPLTAGLQEEAVAVILPSRNGSLWLGTETHGLFRYSERGLERIGVQQGLPNDRVLSLLEDREGSLWVGTNGGLFRLSDAPFTNITRSKGLSDNYVRAVMEHSDGSLWVGTSRGLNRMVGSQVERIGAGHALENASVLSLAQDRDGHVWIGTYHHGALRWDGRDVVARHDRERGLYSNEVRAIVETADGTLWLGTTQGLSRVGNDGIRTYRVADGMPDDYVFSMMASSRGEIWVGTGVGAGVVEGDRIRALDLRQVSDAQAIFAIHEDTEAESVWLVTDRGLIRWRREEGSMSLVGRDAGLPFDKWFYLVADRHDGYWLTSNRGVLRIDRAQAHAAADGRIGRIDYELFTEAEGMASAQCNGGSVPSAALRRDGSVWVATALGVSSVQPWRLPGFAEVVPPVVIESFRADGTVHDWREPQRLPAGTNRVEIHFAGLSFRMPDRIRYRYQLEGLDRRWVERGNVSYAEFTSLPPGDYRFRVQAVQAQGQWGEEETTLAFSVEPYLWQRPWFWLLALACALMLVGLLMNERLRRHRIHERNLQRLVELRTAELREKTEAFERQAREDALTGLSNRRAFDENLTREFRRAVRHGTPLCMALMDIDRFKSINDRWSHAVGDQVLKAVADEMRRQCRDIDLVSRWGGEEFALLFPDTRVTDAMAICERLCQGIAHMDFGDIAPGLKLTASIGLACNTDAPDHDRLMSRVDAALYRAKQEGRNRVVGP
ncbi:MAG TPA: two-component regulator propeller domain-containing protein [Xanthomonadaceae bacterium]|nr:two-component regulator propeller domain-containing protein [Xanthomonadaceae bacterium]